MDFEPVERKASFEAKQAVNTLGCSPEEGLVIKGFHTLLVTETRVEQLPDRSNET
jgi:hypothetical protein